MARKRLYVRDVQAQVDALRAAVANHELLERVDKMWENGDWSPSYNSLVKRVIAIEQRYPDEWSFLNKEHDKLLNEVRELKRRDVARDAATTNVYVDSKIALQRAMDMQNANPWSQLGAPCEIIPEQPRPSLFRRFISLFTK